MVAVRALRLDPVLPRSGARPPRHQLNAEQLLAENEEAMIDFELSSDIVDLRDRVDSFIKEKIVPLKNDLCQTPDGPTRYSRCELVGLGRAAGLLSPHAPKEYGGLGLDHAAWRCVRGRRLVDYSARWRSIQAPDEGNVNLLDVAVRRSRRPAGRCAAGAGEIRPSSR